MKTLWPFPLSLNKLQGNWTYKAKKKKKNNLQNANTSGVLAHTVGKERIQAMFYLWIQIYHLDWRRTKVTRNIDDQANFQW